LLPGFILWIALSAFALVASWMTAAALLPGRGTLARLQAALLIHAALTLTVVQALGAIAKLYRPALALVGLCVFGLAAALAWRRGSLKVPLRHDLGQLRSLAREAWRKREILVLAVVACAVPYGAQTLIIYCFRSWTWDPTWYHVPITNYAITEHGLGFLESHNVRVAGFPRNLELLSVWNVLLPRDSQFDDLAQAPFCLLAFVSMAAWARRLGAPRSLAAGLGAALLLAPPIFLQAGSTHVDIACAALLLTTWEQWTAPRFGRAERLIGWVALFLYVGTKLSGLFHAALLLPLFIARCFISWRRDDGAAVELAWLLPLGLWLGGGLVYLHDWRTHGNPVWPVETRVLGIHLPGTINAAAEWTPPFFQAPGSFMRMVRSWYEMPSPIWPDVRGGGFGPLYRWLSMPCVVLLLTNFIRRRDLARTASVLGLFALALVVPDAWWPRFTICAAAAALGAVCLLWQQLPSVWLRRALSLAALCLACAGIVEGWPGLYPLRFVGRALRRGHFERALIQPIDWLWTEEMCRMREEDLHEGEAIAFDDSIFFLADLWTTNLRNRVIYVQHPSDRDHDPLPSTPALDAQYLQRLRAENATWAAVRPGQSAERALLAAGGKRLFLTPRYQSAVVRTPWAHGR
jgi:hypothetical protein